MPIELEIVLKEIKRLHEKFDALDAHIKGRNITGNWVNEAVALELLNKSKRTLYRIRKHEENGELVGFIRCRRDRGNTWEYHKGDIEKYKSHITVG